MHTFPLFSIFGLSPYFDHGAFTRHAKQILDAPVTPFTYIKLACF